MCKARRKESNLRAIRDIAVQFLYLDAEPTPIPQVMHHPFFSSVSWYLPKEKKWVDITKDKEGLQQIQKALENRIQKSRSVESIFWLMKKPYWLTFLKYIENDLSQQDFNRILADVYLSTEFPSSDANVPVSKLKYWFESADKRYLMTEREMQHYLTLPDKLTVYRGISDLKKSKGLGWTEDRQVALNFATRFRTKKAFVLSADIMHSEVIAYFDRANEKEIICQPKEYTVQKI